VWIRPFLARASVLYSGTALVQEPGTIFLMGTGRDGVSLPEGRFSRGPSIDGKGEFTAGHFEPLSEEPVLGPARPLSGAQAEQIGPQAMGGGVVWSGV
jgi:hypothetical protein